MVVNYELRHLLLLSWSISCCSARQPLVLRSCTIRSCELKTRLCRSRCEYTRVWGLNQSNNSERLFLLNVVLARTCSKLTLINYQPHWLGCIRNTFIFMHQSRSWVSCHSFGWVTWVRVTVRWPMTHYFSTNTLHIVTSIFDAYWSQYRHRQTDFWILILFI